LNKKYGDGIKLTFDLTILKPAEYIAEAEKEEKELEKARQEKIKINRTEDASFRMDFGNLMSSAMEGDEEPRMSMSFPKIIAKTKE